MGNQLRPSGAHLFNRLRNVRRLDLQRHVTRCKRHEWQCQWFDVAVQGDVVEILHDPYHSTPAAALLVLVSDDIWWIRVTVLSCGRFVDDKSPYRVGWMIAIVRTTRT